MATPERRTDAAAAPAPRSWLRPLTDFVSPLGFLVVAGAAASFVLAFAGGWAEFALIGYVLVAVLVLCVLLTVGRTELRVTVTLQPTRVRVGEIAGGRVDVVNCRRRRQLPIPLELPVGASVGRFHLPGLAAGAQFSETFAVPTARRGVIPVGPATTVRGDPFGLLRRTLRWTDRLELFVHPRLVPIDAVDSGLLRDLEGRSTPDISVSDLAFHSLREYTPGDDRRYIHWRSSAKASGGMAGATFLVRQFLDTRRSHLCVVIDADDLAYGDEDDFETAISAGGSIAVRAIRDEMQTTVVAGDQIVHEGTAQRTLDGLARAVPVRAPLAALSNDAARVAPATSVALIVTGALSDFADIRRALANFPADVATVVLRVDPSRPIGNSTVSGTALLSIRELADLPRLLHAGLVG